MCPDKSVRDSVWTRFTPHGIPFGTVYEDQSKLAFGTNWMRKVPQELGRRVRLRVGTWP